MDFDINQPIYIQIGSQIKENILNGTIQSGEKLPSVREYSMIYEVSALTIHRTMQYLEQQGIIYSQKGVGSFVRSDLGEQLETQMIQVQVDSFIQKMKNCGLKEPEILALVQKRLGEGKDNE